SRSPSSRLASAIGARTNILSASTAPFGACTEAPRAARAGANIDFFSENIRNSRETIQFRPDPLDLTLAPCTPLLGAAFHQGESRSAQTAYPGAHRGLEATREGGRQAGPGLAAAAIMLPDLTPFGPLPNIAPWIRNCRN